MQFQAGSNKAARRVNAAGDQGFGGTWGIWRRSSGHPPYRMDDPDDEIAAAAAKIAFDAGTAHLWPRAIWRYNALHTYRKTVLRRAARLGMSSACGLLRKSEQAPLSPPPSAPAPQGTVVPAAPATPQSLLANDSIAFAPAAADDVAHGIADRRLVSLLAWIAQRHRIVVSVIKTGHPRFVTGTHKVSNHWYGRAATISEVDGRAVTRARQPPQRSGISCRRRPRRSGPTRSARPGRRPAIRAGSAGPDEQAEIHVGFDAVGRRSPDARRRAQVTLTLPFMPLAAWPLMAQ